MEEDVYYPPHPSDFDLIMPPEPSGYGMIFGALTSGLSLFMLVFTIWMIVDCIRNDRGYYWIFIMLAFPALGSVIYFFAYVMDSTFIFRRWINAHHRKQRAVELKNKVHHIDNAYHRTELGNVYLDLEKWPEARAEFEAALAHDPKSFEASVHLGYALMGLGLYEEAWKRFEAALGEEFDYEYGELSWKAAKCRVKLGDPNLAREIYERLLSRHHYTGAQLEYAEVLHQLGESQSAKALLEKIIAEAPHAAKFQRSQERRIARQAKRRLREMQN